MPPRSRASVSTPRKAPGRKSSKLKPALDDHTPASTIGKLLDDDISASTIGKTSPRPREVDLTAKELRNLQRSVNYLTSPVIHDHGDLNCQDPSEESEGSTPSLRRAKLYAIPLHPPSPAPKGPSTFARISSGVMWHFQNRPFLQKTVDWQKGLLLGTLALSVAMVMLISSRAEIAATLCRIPGTTMRPLVCYTTISRFFPRSCEGALKNFIAESTEEIANAFEYGAPLTVRDSSDGKWDELLASFAQRARHLSRAETPAGVSVRAAELDVDIQQCRTDSRKASKTLGKMLVELNSLGSNTLREARVAQKAFKSWRTMIRSPYKELYKLVSASETGLNTKLLRYSNEAMEHLPVILAEGQALVETLSYLINNLGTIELRSEELRSLLFPYTPAPFFTRMYRMARSLTLWPESHQLGINLLAIRARRAEVVDVYDRVSKIVSGLEKVAKNIDELKLDAGGAEDHLKLETRSARALELLDTVIEQNRESIERIDKLYVKRE